MSVRFDGSTDALSATANLPAVTAVTMMGWFYLSADRGAAANFFAYGDSSGSAYVQLGIDQAGTNTNLFIWPGETSSTNGSNLSLSTWYHLALVMRGSAVAPLGYINGALDITSSVGQSSGVSAEKMWVGNDNDAEWLSGRAAAVKVYSAVLSIEEIRREMRQIAPVRTADLSRFSPLRWAGETQAGQDNYGPIWTVGGTLTTEPGPNIPWKVGDRSPSSYGNNRHPRHRNLPAGRRSFFLMELERTTPDDIQIYPRRSNERHQKPPAYPFQINPHSPQASGLALWFPGNPSGPLVEMVYGNHATGSAIPARAGLPDGGPAFKGGLVDGTNRYASFTRKLLAAGQTLCGWVRTSSTDATRTYEGNQANTLLGDTTASVMQAFGIHDGKAEFSYYAGGWGFVAGATSINDGNWHHIAASYSTAGAIRVYVDGNLDGTLDGATYDVALQGVNTIGAGYNPNDYFDGDFYDVRVYDRPLPPSVIRAIWSRETRYDLWGPRRRRAGFATTGTAVAAAPIVHRLTANPQPGSTWSVTV